MQEVGSRNLRAFIGPPEQFDFMGATQMSLLYRLGLREDHTVVDLGCGALRAGRLLIPFLNRSRYHGIEPNSWLIEGAIAEHIGQDLVNIKQPTFHSESDFSMKGIADGCADFVVAQSIYSHTDLTQFRRAIHATERCLASSGHALFTVILPHDAAAPTMPYGRETTGWTYPGCVKYDEGEVEEIVSGTRLMIQRLPWFHPRQTWFHCVSNEEYLLSEDQLVLLGDGKPMFDDRFG